FLCSLLSASHQVHTVFFFKTTSTTEVYTLSLHDALPILCWGDAERIDPEDSEIEPVAGRYTRIKQTNLAATGYQGDWVVSTCWRSEEHTSELQSREKLVCRLLLEKKKKTNT